MNLKYLLFSLFLIGISISQSNAQKDIVDWTFEIKEVDGIKTLVATGDISEGWYIYSQHTDDEGPIPTSFEIKDASGKMTSVVFEEETTPIKKYSELFEVEVLKFKDKAIFTYELDDKSDIKLITGALEYMSCDKSRCLPPKLVEFEAKI
ncbi:protein-disulfide reductase DsbD N-terminal domain-containing protein [Saprospiraceae bacterium]|nr:protein-disulfide reductase DsbD N-terminal domain-containing protein [Saprospiraceae bacterium]